MDLGHLVDPQSIDGCDPIKVKAIQELIEQKILSESSPLVLVYNITRFKRGIEFVKKQFPVEHFLHTMAIKANPLSSLMKEATNLGLGFEAASFGELTQALRFAKSSQHIVFDSPVKTRQELEFALSKGVYLNADNLQELDTITELVSANKYSNLNVGIRVNPQVGVGAIKEMSTGGPISKFGIAMNDYQKEILQIYAERPWLNGIHIHVGSQGCPLDLIMDGISKVLDLVEQVNSHGIQQIKFIDIGGGFPVNFNDEHDNVTLYDSNGKSETFNVATYADLLKTKFPVLFSGKFKVITEFGRTYNAKPGFFVSRVEYTKVSGGRNIAIIHAGADLCVRTVWGPTKWPVRVTVLDKTGQIKHGTVIKQDVAGPCCFAGDIIAHERELPLIERGDYIVIHDCGGYYYSAYSYYNLRQAPSVYGFEEDDTHTFKLLKKGQSVEETLQMFTSDF